MKKISFLTVLLLSSAVMFAQTGKYAGSKKSMIGKTYTDSRYIPDLTGWQFQDGTMLNATDDTVIMTANIYKKGTTYIVLFSVKENPADKSIFIADLLELKNVLTSQQLRTGSCKEGANEAVDIVALIKKGNSESSKAIKAWRFNRDKKRIEGINASLVTCMNEG